MITLFQVLKPKGALYPVKLAWDAPTVRPGRILQYRVDAIHFRDDGSPDVHATTRNQKTVLWLTAGEYVLSVQAVYAGGVVSLPAQLSVTIGG
jgi:hypothetical protein